MSVQVTKDFYLPVFLKHLYLTSMSIIIIIYLKANMLSSTGQNMKIYLKDNSINYFHNREK